MAGMKITKFLGIAPKISPELLPDTAGQIAQNLKLYSGDLIPHSESVIAGATGRAGGVKTIYALRSPSNNELQWLSWTTDVNIAIATPNENDNQRFYYTGDGAPKVSDYSLATNGVPPYPIGYYDLGLPVPTTKPTTTATPFSTKATASYARDANGTATIVTSTPHGLSNGTAITVSGFTSVAGTYSQVASTTVTITINNHGLANGTNVVLDFTSGTAPDGTYIATVTGTNTFTITVPTSATTSGDVLLDLTAFNVISGTATVVNSTTITYSSVGPQISTTAYTAGRVDLAGFTQNRTYAYTWYTPWGEESIASNPSADLLLKEGQVVTVSNLPSAKPTGNNFVRGIRLYRTVSSASGTAYFRINTFWFPTALSRVQRTSNVSRVTTALPHNLDIDNYFKISGCSVASFDIAGGVVTNVIDQYTFEYAQVAGDEPSTPVSTGTLYIDVSANPGTSTPQYWGETTYDFTDDYNVEKLLFALESNAYEAPPAALKGLTAMNNNILAGFVANEIYFSELNLPHAWPPEYKVTIEHDIVGLAAIGGSLLVLTNSYPYLIAGSDPANGFSVQRIDVQYPCLNAKSIVTMGYGIVYSTYDGLAIYSPYAGPQVITKTNFEKDTWNETLDPSTIIAQFYGDTYVASHSTGAFSFERDERIGGLFITYGGFEGYLLLEDGGHILLEDGGSLLLDVPNSFAFSSSWFDSVSDKLFYTLPNYGDVFEWDNLSQPNMTLEWKSKVFKTQNMINLGAARVIADYDDVSTNALTSNWEDVLTKWESTSGTYETTDQVTFRLWVNKNLLFTTTLSSSDVFRLPSGYRSDTFEVGVSSTVRIREIHLAETPLGLKRV